MGENKNIWIVTDSNSGISPKEAEKLNIGIVPMPFTVDQKEYLENISLNRDDFFKMMSQGKDVKTSQPSVANLIKLFEDGLKLHDEIVYIPMSSGLSGSYMTAKCLASSFLGKVQVVDNLRISCTQKQSVLEALYLANKGKNAEEIRIILENHKKDASIYISVDTLDYLKKGGRITTACASVSSNLDIRPILQIQGDKLDLYAKTRGVKNTQRRILEAISYDMSHRFFGKDVIIKGAYTGSEEKAQEWLRCLCEYFPAHLISIDPLPLSISCHIGPQSIAAVCMEKIEEAPFTMYEI